MCHAVDTDIHPLKATIVGRLRLGHEGWLHAVSLRVSRSRKAAALVVSAGAAAVLQAPIDFRPVTPATTPASVQ